jgi:hypothetical protein
MPDSIDYKSPQTETPHPTRPLSKWLILLLVWFAGLVMWVFYVGLALVVLYKFL